MLMWISILYLYNNPFTFTYQWVVYRNFQTFRQYCWMLEYRLIRFQRCPLFILLPPCIFGKLKRIQWFIRSNVFIYNHILIAEEILHFTIISKDVQGLTRVIFVSCAITLLDGCKYKICIHRELQETYRSNFALLDILTKKSKLQIWLDFCNL